MSTSLSYAGVILAVSVSALSITAQSQSTISLERCHKATQSVSLFVMASTDRQREQLLNNEIALEAHELQVQRLEDFKRQYTFGHCMEGQAPEVFQCLASQSGDLTRCTQ